jgi:hypothetical protein
MREVEMADGTRWPPGRRKRVIFGALFTVDSLLVLAPPVYWLAGVSEIQRPIPISLVYFLGTGLLIVLSVLALYRVERTRGELD